MFKLINQDLPKVEPVFRHGQKSLYKTIDTASLEQVRLQLEQDIASLKKEDLTSIALIGLTYRMSKNQVNT
jgi:DNA helicase-2/ATP-dependent DNA helicase PcrA